MTTNIEGIPTHLYDALRAAAQEHVLRFWQELEASQRAGLVEQLEAIDLEHVKDLASGRHEAQVESGARRDPAQVVRLQSEPHVGSRAEALERGRRLLEEGSIGIFLVAGGQGTRLGFSGPKGCLPVAPLSRKTLFELHAQKIAALAKRFGKPPPWYIMTSQANNAATREFLEQNSYFGLREEDVILFEQEMNPALDPAGKLILESRGKVFMNPNGHGGSYGGFLRSGALEDAARRGLEHLFYFQVDNPLIRIADPLFMGLHDLARSEMSLKVVRKTGPEEKVGVAAIENGRPKVIEYSDLSAEEAALLDDEGHLVYWAGSIGIHAFRLDFFRRVAEGTIELPLHVARKKIPAVGETGEPTEIEGRKYEMFVFDALPHATRTLNLEVRREREFAPVKNKAGVDSLESAQELMITEHRRWLAEAGVEVGGRVEVSPLAALGAGDLVAHLRAARSHYEGDVLVERAADDTLEVRTP